MTRHARPRLLRERWLDEESPGSLDSNDLAERLAYWHEREASFRRFAPFDLEGPGFRPTREARGLCEAWFPLERIARDVHAVLRARFGRALRAIDPGWESDALTRAGTWLDARRALASLGHEALPSRLLERLANDRDEAEAFAFELHDPVAFGCGLARYPEVLARVAKVAPATRVRAWDAGCGTGEGAISLARALACRACGRTDVEVIGTTPLPFELVMARRLGRPHDRGRTEELRRAASKLEREPPGIAVGAPENHGVRVRFEPGDLLKPEQAPRECDVVVVGGVLGGVLSSESEVAQALETVARSLKPGGRAFVVDRFRADRAQRARELVRALAPRVGLEPAPDGCELVGKTDSQSFANETGVADLDARGDVTVR